MNTPAPILYVEDDDNDAVMLRLALRRADVAHPVIVVTSGETAVQYLLGEGEYADRVRHPFPCLVLLDIKLPAMSGLQVLRRMQTRGLGTAVPLVMFTSSAEVPHQHQATYWAAADYMTKPRDLEGFVTTAQYLRERWGLQAME